MPTNFSTVTKAGIDTNDNTAVTDALDVRGGNNLAFQVIAKTGTHSTHVITLQVSADKITWINSTHTLTGVGIKDNLTTALCWARLKVTTAESATSTCDVFLQSK